MGVKLATIYGLKIHRYQLRGNADNYFITFDLATFFHYKTLILSTTRER